MEPLDHPPLPVRDPWQKKATKRKQSQSKFPHLQPARGVNPLFPLPVRFHFSADLRQLLGLEFAQRIGGGLAHGRGQGCRIELAEKFQPASPTGKIRPTVGLHPTPFQLQLESLQLQGPLRHRGPDLHRGNGHAAPDVPCRGHQNFRPTFLRATDFHAELSLDFWRWTSQITQNHLRLTPSFGNGKLLRRRLPARFRSYPAF